MAVNTWVGKGGRGGGEDLWTRRYMDKLDNIKRRKKEKGTAGERGEARGVERKKQNEEEGGEDDEGEWGRHEEESQTRTN